MINRTKWVEMDAKCERTWMHSSNRRQTRRMNHESGYPYPVGANETENQQGNIQPENDNNETTPFHPAAWQMKPQWQRTNECECRGCGCLKGLYGWLCRVYAAEWSLAGVVSLIWYIHDSCGWSFTDSRSLPSLIVDHHLLDVLQRRPLPSLQGILCLLKKKRIQKRKQGRATTRCNEMHWQTIPQTIKEYVLNVAQWRTKWKKTSK